jgi:NAD(P)-dependent dehydrogenase (short-subunit alcohol dehydrogenase family)
MQKKAIFITGASSGIGLASAHRLYTAGFTLIAGVLAGEDTGPLDIMGTERLHIVPVDVTDTSSIYQARDQIDGIVGTDGLYGLFNNAGVGVAGPIETTPVEILRNTLEINLIGHYSVTQAMLPQVRKAKGRIVNTASILGRIALPFSSQYCMSKFAMEAFTDSLRAEMKPFGVKVSAIEPGAIKTAIWDKVQEQAEELEAEFTPEGQSLYGSSFRKMITVSQEAAADGIKPSEVADAVLDAFTARNPKTRYLVGQDAKSIGLLRRLLPDRLLDRILARQYPIH